MIAFLKRREVTLVGLIVLLFTRVSLRAPSFASLANVNPEVAQNTAVFPDDANLALMVSPAALGNATRESMTAVYTSFKKGK